MHRTSKRRAMDKSDPPSAENRSSRTDFEKLDGRLTAAIEGAGGADGPSLTVFVNLDPARKGEHAAVLRHLGRPSDEDTSGPLTATLSPDKVRELSIDPAVAYITLAASCRPLPGGDPR